MNSSMRAADLLMAAVSALALSSGVNAAGALPAPASPDPATPKNEDILVTAQKRQQTIENAPNSHATVTADQIATSINAVNAEDALKYLPSLIVRKRHIGDTQAPLATRTSGLGSSARSLIYADGALLSALIGNNNTTASPRWSLVCVGKDRRPRLLRIAGSSGVVSTML